MYFTLFTLRHGAVGLTSRIGPMRRRRSTFYDGGFDGTSTQKVWEVRGLRPLEPTANCEDRKDHRSLAGHRGHPVRRRDDPSHERSSRSFHAADGTGAFVPPPADSAKVSSLRQAGYLTPRCLPAHTWASQTPNSVRLSPFYIMFAASIAAPFVLPRCTMVYGARCVYLLPCSVDLLSCARLTPSCVCTLSSLEYCSVLHRGPEEISFCSNVYKLYGGMTVKTHLT